MRKLITSIAIAAAILSGCTKEEPVTPVIPEEPVNLELTAEIPETRTYLGDITYDGNNKPVGRKVFWSTGDVVAVWSDDTPNTQNYTLSKGAGSNRGTFVYKPNAAVPSGVVGSEFYAVYPSKIVTGGVTNNTAHINLPSTQSTKIDADGKPNFSVNTNPMVAVGTVLSRADGKGGMTFHNLCGILVVNVIADQDLTVDRIRVSASGQSICGEADVTLGGDEPVITLLGSNTLTLDCKNYPLKENESQEFYIVVPAGKYTQMTISIYTDRGTTETPSLQKTRKKAITIEAGQITNVGADLKLITKEPVKYKIGDLYPDATNPVGIVFALTNPTTNDDHDLESTKGKMVYLTKITKQEKFYYTNDQSKFNTNRFGTNTNNGMANLTQAKNSLSTGEILADVFPAYGAVQALGTNWYLPARNELQVLIDEMSTVNEVYKKATGETTDLIAFSSEIKAPKSNTYCSSTAFFSDGLVSIYGYNKVGSWSGWTEILCLLMKIEGVEPSVIESGGLYKVYSDLKFKILPVSTFDSTK